MTMLAGLALAVLLWWALKAFGRSSPRQVAHLVRWIGGLLALGLAAILTLRGRLDMALLVGGGGAWLMGYESLSAMMPWRRGVAGRSGSVSRVRSAMIEMELDHASGRIAGHVLAGTYAGRSLDRMSDVDLRTLRANCLSQDAEGARLLEAYLDRRFPAWREDAEPDADRGRQADPKLGAMTKQEAYQVLGLEPGAETGAVRAAHRILMKKLHPDHGGSTYLASRVNQAKDVLLDRHR